MTDLEIPFEKDRRGHYRFFEILPGSLSWLFLFLPLILSLINVTLAVFFILIYLLVFFVRSIAYTTRALTGYRTMKRHMKLDWNGLNADIEAGKFTDRKLARPKWHADNLKRCLDKGDGAVKPSRLLHAVIIATVNESREVLEPTIQAVLASDYDPKKLMLVIAYEGRAGKEAEDRVHELLDLYLSLIHI